MSDTFDLKQAVMDNSGLKAAPVAALPADPIVAPKRARPGPRRRLVATKAATIPISKDKLVQRYQFTGLIAALVVLELVWVALWVANGYLSMTALSRWIGLAFGFGAVIHLCVSLCQQHLPRIKAIMFKYKMQDLWKVLRWVIWPLLFTVTLFDVLSSSSGIQLFFADRGWPYHGYAVFPITMLGSFIALASERLIVYTAMVIYRLVKR